MSSPRLDQTPAGWNHGADQYHTVFAPLTGAFADDAVELLGVSGDDTVLDVAAGSGAFTTRAARRGAAVMATDFAPAMLDTLRRDLPDDLPGSVRTAVMDGQALELENARFSVAASMFGVIFFPNAGAGLRELARVTQDRGRLAIASWSDEGPRLSQLVAQAVRAARPGVALPTAPAGLDLGTPAGCATTLIEHGWRDVEVHVVSHDLMLDDPAEFFRSLPEWSAPVRALTDLLDADQVEAAADAFADIVAGATPSGDRVPFTGLISIGVPT